MLLPPPPIIVTFLLPHAASCSMLVKTLFCSSTVLHMFVLVISKDKKKRSGSWAPNSLLATIWSPAACCSFEFDIFFLPSPSPHPVMEQQQELPSKRSRESDETTATTQQQNKKPKSAPPTIPISRGKFKQRWLAKHSSLLKRSDSASGVMVSCNIHAETRALVREGKARGDIVFNNTWCYRDKYKTCWKALLHHCFLGMR